jgi:hypothetical protein
MSTLTFLAAVIVCALALIGIILSVTVFVRAVRNGSKKSTVGREEEKK